MENPLTRLPGHSHEEINIKTLLNFFLAHANKILILVSWISCLIYGKDIAVVTVVIGSSYYQATLPGILSKRDYCQKHGYNFICITETIDPLRHPAWQKIKAVEKALENHDWVFWSDADSIIMNDNIVLEDLTDDSCSFIICYDNLSNVVNSGEFLIKRNQHSFEFLDKVYRSEEFLTHPWWENAAIIKILGETTDRDFAKILPQRSMNAFAPEVCGVGNKGCYQKGDFIIHFPSVHDLVLLRTLMWKYYHQSYSPREIQ